MVFLPRISYDRQNTQWTGEILFIQLSESTKLALNSNEINSLHLVVNRSDYWQNAVKLFHSHAGLSNIQLIRKLPRDEGIRLTFGQLPVSIFIIFIYTKDKNLLFFFRRNILKN